VQFRCQEGISSESAALDRGGPQEIRRRPRKSVITTRPEKSYKWVGERARSTMNEHPVTEHPARELPEQQRRKYLTALAAMIYADGVRNEKEVEALRSIGTAVELPSPVVEATNDSMRDPDRAVVDAILGEIKSDDVLRWSLLTDAILLIFSDHQVAAAEAVEIAEYADRLGVSTAQAVLMGRYVEHVLLHEEGTELSKALAEGLAEAQAQLHPARGLKWLHRKLEERRR
jgi:uncharacterized tellurite resistance protein B-like protein